MVSPFSTPVAQWTGTEWGIVAVGLVCAWYLLIQRRYGQLIWNRLFLGSTPKLKEEAEAIREFQNSQVAMDYHVASEWPQEVSAASDSYFLVFKGQRMFRIMAIEGQPVRVMDIDTRFVGADRSAFKAQMFWKKLLAANPKTDMEMSLSIMAPEEQAQLLRSIVQRDLYNTTGNVRIAGSGGAPAGKPGS